MHFSPWSRRSATWCCRASLAVVAVMCWWPGQVHSALGAEAAVVNEPATLAISLLAIDLTGQKMGSAVCVDDRGYFVTSRRLLGDMNPGDRVRGMLRPGRHDGRAVEAVVVALSDADDLAMLWVAYPRDANFKAWPLAADTILKAMLPITVTGHPLLRDRDVNGRDYPKVAAAAGKIVALEKKAEFSRIQTDVASHPGLAGGAVTDASGQLLGIVSPGDADSDGVAAVPVNRIRHFLRVPFLVPSRPVIRFADRHKPASFKFELVQMLKTSETWTADLVLSDGLTNRTIPLKRQGDQFVAEAAPLPPAKRPFQLLALVQVGGRQLKGQIEDRLIQVGGASLHLTQVRRIENRLDGSIVYTTDQHKLAGAITGLGEMQVHGGERIKLDDARLISLFAADEVTRNIDFEARLRQGGRLAASITGALPLQGPPAPSDTLASEEKVRGAADEIIVEALVDGESNLVILDGGIYWTYARGAPPGEPENGNRHVFVNGKRWDLKWLAAEGEDGEGGQSEALPTDVGAPDYMFKLLSISKKRGGPSTVIDLINFYDYPKHQLVTFNNYGRGPAWYKFRLVRRDAVRDLKVQVEPDNAEMRTLLRELNPGDADVLARLKRMSLIHQYDASAAPMMSKPKIATTQPLRGSLAKTVVVGKQYAKDAFLTGPGVKLPAGHYLVVARLAALTSKNRQTAYLGVHDKATIVKFRVADASECPPGQWSSVAVEFTIAKDLEQAEVRIAGDKASVAVDKVYFFKVE